MAETTWADFGIIVVNFARDDIWGFGLALLMVTGFMMALVGATSLLLPRVTRLLSQAYRRRREEARQERLFDDC